MVNRNQSLHAASLFPLITLALVVLVFVLYWPSLAAAGGTYIVNTTADTDDGICDGTHCSLREAMNAANIAFGADTITFALPPDATITLAGSQLPTITDTLTIDGSTAENLTISGNGFSRIFKVGCGTAVTITTLILADGFGESGGAIYNDGGFLNVRTSTFLYNWAWEYQGGGGAIANFGGTLNVNDSFFDTNVAGDMGGGVLNINGTAIIHDSTFSANSANWNAAGGGVNPYGGAINNQNGTLTISNSTFSDNYCVGYHGGCFGGGIANSGVLNLYNSTLSDNTATAYPAAQGGGIFNDTSGQLHISNTIIANSTGGDCISITMSDSVNNLVEDGSCNSTFSGDPLLGPLQDNGGPTWTQAPLSISRAVDNGENDICAAPPVNNLDQRSITRPFDGDGDGIALCDIGAYEYDGPPPLRSFLPLLLRK
ncbi:MAG: choice-of-anchor Q domain-containing protein [Candidatus Promineifilaceae bacterium]